MHINLLCSDRHLPQDIWAKSNEGKWGGVDRGALILLKHQIIPFFSVGDFDSVSKEERQLLTEQLQIKPVQAEKADTDLALAVDKAVALGFDSITIYGATGGRLDHFFGAIQLLLKKAYYKHDVHIEVIDQQNKIELLPKGQHTVEKDKSSLAGFKYNLARQMLNIGSTLTISNEIESLQAKVTVHDGLILQIRSTDLN